MGTARARGKSRLFLIVLLAISLIPTHYASALLGLDGWDYRKGHTITGTTAGEQVNYQIGIKTYFGVGTDGTEVVGNATYGKVYLNSKSQTDFDDVRFTDSDGSTLIDYWLFNKSDSDFALFWVEVPTIPASPGTTQIFIYYGNSTVASLSNFTNTFNVTKVEYAFEQKSSNLGDARVNFYYLDPDTEQQTVETTYVNLPANLIWYSINKTHTPTTLRFNDTGYTSGSGVDGDAHLRINTLTGNTWTDTIIITMHYGDEDGTSQGIYPIFAQDYYSGAWRTKTSDVVASDTLTANVGTSSPINLHILWDVYTDLMFRKFVYPEPVHTSWTTQQTESGIENVLFVASDNTVDDEQWFFLNATLEIGPNATTFLFNRIDIDSDGLNLSCSYTNSTNTFVEVRDPNNYLQFDVDISVKTDLNNTFVRVGYYLRFHPNVTQEGLYNVTVYSTISGDLNDTDAYTDVFTLTIRTPSTPTLLFGAGFNASSPYVELHWTHDLVALTLFQVYNSTDGESWDYLGTNTTTQYTDSQVVNGTARYYKVEACRDTGVGWKNTTTTLVDFETVYYVKTIGAAPIVAGDTINMGGAGIIWLIGIIIIPIVIYMLNKR